MQVLYAITLILLLGAVFLMHVKTSGILNRVEGMIDDAIEGTLQEKEFSEQRMSRIESRLYRYLCAGKSAKQQADREKNSIKSLISDVSHQTKTPLANILLYTQLLAEADILDQNLREIISRIEGQTQKLDFLICSLIKLSRLENGIIAVSPCRGSVEELLGRLDFGAAAQEKGIRLTVDSTPGLMAVFDMKWTLEALENVVDNALKYTQAGGEVRVYAGKYEMFVCINVTDNGIGISEEETAKIFARFYRSQTAKDEEGVGIGLYLAREILRQEGGYIRVRSKPGEGSVFSLFLPVENVSKL